MFVRHICSLAKVAGDVVVSCPVCQVREKPFGSTKPGELAETHEGHLLSDAAAQCLRQVACTGSSIFRVAGAYNADIGLSGGQAS
jgi:hypothetical protein